MGFLNWLHSNAGALLDAAAIFASGAVYVAHTIGKVKHRLWIDTLAEELDKLRRQVNGVGPGPTVIQQLCARGFKSSPRR